MERNFLKAVALSIFALVLLLCMVVYNVGNATGRASLEKRDYGRSLMPLIMHSAPVRRAKAGVPTGNNNPDSYAAATEIYGSKDYETEVSGDVLSQEDIAIGTWGAAYGYGSTGAWRFTPRPITSGSNEDSAGWYADTGTIPVDECSVLTYSFMFYISQALVTKILDSGTSFWGSNNKVIDVFMWDSAGSAVDSNTRQVVMFGKSNGTIPGLIFTPIAGGGGGIGYAETSIDPLVDLDFTDLADQWIWLSFVMDASGATDATRYTRLYYKKVGDAGVTKFLRPRRHGRRRRRRGRFVQVHDTGMARRSRPHFVRILGRHGRRGGTARC